MSKGEKGLKIRDESDDENEDEFEDQYGPNPFGNDQGGSDLDEFGLAPFDSDDAPE